jgi:hypothetical protein
VEIAELVLEYVKVVAWPLVVVAGLFMFRRTIRSVLKRITEASGFGATLKLVTESIEVAERSEDIPAVEGADENGAYDGGRVPLHPIYVSNLDEVQRIYGELLISAAAAIERSGAEVGALPTLEKAAKRLHSMDLIDDVSAEVAVRLERLRRDVTSSPGLTLTREVLDNYRKAAAALGPVLNNVGRNG